MAPGALISPSISSQTLTASPTHHLPLDLHPSSDQALLSTLSNSPYTFLQPPPSLHTAALVLAKRYLDPLAASVSKTQEARLQEKRKKRKRGEVDYGSADEILRLEQVHLEGFGIQQVWEQTRRVLDAGRNEIERSLFGQAESLPAHGLVAINGEAHDKNYGQIKQVRFQDDGLQATRSEEDYLEGPELELENTSEDGELLEEEVDINNGSIGSEHSQDILDDGDDIEIDDMELDVDDASGQDQADSFVPDKHGLNDGFFSIDEFNRTSEFLEQQDARGDPNDGAASDEEDIDWDADPMTRSGPSNDNQEMDGDTQGNDNDSEEDGPTLGNADLNAPDTSSDDDDDDDDDIGIQQNSNTNDVKYADFFEPPPRALTKNSRRRALPKTQPPPQANEDDIQCTISAVRRDLFEDDLSNPSESEGDVSTALPGSQNLSSHQKRQAAISAQIRQLEAANVAKRDWTLSGEARAAERPINSLLEEALDFERVGKPVTVVTQEVSEDIEALVKRRVLAREFDEVIRRRPGLVTQTPDIRRGRTELDDTRDKRGLGELYEEEHLQAIDPSGHPDKRDERLKKQHSEIERLWKDVSSKLDALSSFNYRPKPPEVNVTVVTDVPAVRMEDARPSGVGGVGDVGGGESRLAPQEVYKPGEEKVREEVVAGGKPVGREEMTREEKLRRRRREKERIKKAGGPMKKDGALKAGGKSSKREERDGVLSDLKKGGVKVIGKRGDVKDVEGKAVKAIGNGKGAGGFKL
ncbi:U3 snoRNP protein [Varicellaria rhodocarpa]|nr:U3 snoRNP protein [Varicellaria rhodocarpa]